MRRLAIALAVVSALVFTACGGDSAEGRLGQELYGAVCASCHRSGGEGGVGPAIDEGSEAASLTDEQLAGVIRAGPGSMPAFGRLSDAQIDSLVAHVRLLQGLSG